MFPNAKILNKSSVDGGHGVRVLLKRPDHINVYTDSKYIRTLISNLEQKTGLPTSSIKIVDVVYAQHLKTIESFTVVLTQNYKKTALNFPNWSDAMRMAK
jgi:ribonuclease HI